MLSPFSPRTAYSLRNWKNGNETTGFLVTVDNATGNWTGPMGVVTLLLSRIRVDAEHTTVMVFGPKILNLEDELLGGRSVHPVGMCLGGFYAGPETEDAALRSGKER